MSEIKWYCNWSKSLGGLENNAFYIWDTPPYEYLCHKHDNLIQFGMYDLSDYITIWRHKGRRCILWAGFDILNLRARFSLNNSKLRFFRPFHGWMCKWLNKNVENWVENETEKKALNDMGISVVEVCPSFLGDMNVLNVSYKWNKRMNVYVSAAEGREREYGFTTVLNIAYALPDMVFHFYGSDSWKKNWETNSHNDGLRQIIFHGRVPKAQMNEEIRNMQVGLRLNEFDGFSEIIAKAVLMGQYVISKVEHPFIPTFKNDMDLTHQLKLLQKKKKPNIKVRDWYRAHINKFPWTKDY